MYTKNYHFSYFVAEAINIYPELIERCMSSKQKKITEILASNNLFVTIMTAQQIEAVKCSLQEKLELKASLLVESELLAIESSDFFKAQGDDNKKQKRYD